MTLDEIRASQLALEATITALVQEFEKGTTCIVHSLPVRPATATAKTTVEVKVQI